MLITLSPQRRDDIKLDTLSVSGDTLTINGQPLDLSAIAEGDQLPAEAVSSPFVVGTITRTAGAINITLFLPLGPKAPEAARFPGTLDQSNGPITLPPYEVTA